MEWIIMNLISIMKIVQKIIKTLKINIAWSEI